MKKISMKQKIMYRFDNIMSKGAPAMIASLAIASFFLIIVISIITFLTRTVPDKSFLQIVWMSLMRTLDPGTMGGDEGSWLFLFFMFAVTLGGIFVISILIGILTTGIESKLESLRKGRSIVIEKGHTVILGWSEQIYTMISELIEANSNLKKSCIAILGEKDKVEMEDLIKERIKDLKNTKIVCRQGSPLELNDLEMVNINLSKSIIILDDQDKNIIKTVLAIVNGKKDRNDDFHITAVLNDAKNLEAGKIAGAGQVEFVIAKDIISKLIAQTCLQPGLSAVYTELLDFAGDEIYFSKVPELTGKTFKEAMFLFEKSTLIGINSSSGTNLNPPMDTVIKKNDDIISISSDDDTVNISELKNSVINKDAFKGSNKNHKEEIKKNTLILGWNEEALKIILEIDNYVSNDSSLTVAADFSGLKDEYLSVCRKKVNNQKIEFIQADINDREILNALVLKNFDHIIILSYCNLEAQEADAVTLITLLHLRDISEKTGIKFSIISEMIDIRNRSLAKIAKVNDFIVSGKLISLIMAQISENKMLNLVFNDLFDAQGSEIYIKNICNYIDCLQEVNFYTILEAAAENNEIAIGYKIADFEIDADKNFGIVINPLKSEMLKFKKEDSIILISEN